MALAVAAPEVASLLLLHRHLDGVISFAVENDGDWRPLHAVRASDFESMFPEFRAQLCRDSFVSINAAHRMARRSKGRIGVPAHRTDTLRYLCACYCDIDCYKLGISSGLALEFVDDCVIKGTLPTPSGIALSGRGVWLLWLLHDESEPTSAHFGAFDDNPKNHLKLYAKINREIGRRLSAVGADPAATDAARYMRFPGSFRSDIEETVVWQWNDTNGSVASHSLQSLASFLGVLEEPSKPPARNPAAKGSCPLRRRGFDAANQNRLSAFEALRELRGGFVEGKRATAAFIYAACLRWSGLTWFEVTSTLEEFGRSCFPPLASRECLRATKSAFEWRSGKMRYSWIADQLEVLPSEARFISDILGKYFPAASQFGDQAPSARTESKRAGRQVVRRQEIEKLICEHGHVPSCRVLSGMLAHLGISAGHVTVRADLRARETSQIEASDSCIGADSMSQARS